MSLVVKMELVEYVFRVLSHLFFRFLMGVCFMSSYFYHVEFSTVSFLICMSVLV